MDKVPLQLEPRRAADAGPYAPLIWLWLRSTRNNLWSMQRSLSQLRCDNERAVDS